jgi:putative transposase
VTFIHTFFFITLFFLILPSRPQENPVAERINGIRQNELLLVEDKRTFEEVVKKLPEAVRIYNELRPHASIDYLTPMKAHQ